MTEARPISQEEIEALEACGKKIKGRREYRRLESVLLRAKDNKNAEEIGEILKIHPRTVEKHHERYFKQGLDAFLSKKPGPKGPQFLTKEEESQFFESMEEKASTGEILRAGGIKPLYEEKAGRECSLGTIYVALKRNKWSKKQPRPKHPKGDNEAKTLFKKTV